MAEVELIWRLASSAEDAGEFDKARTLYERGAALGDPSSLHALGYLFDLGRGVAQDKALAMRYYKAAWRSHEASAANNIAILYREKGDRRAMFRWFRRAAEEGHDGAYLQLAKCYLNGVGVRKSSACGIRCLAAVLRGRQTCEADLEEAEAMLAAFRPSPV